ncbi:MAG: 2-iminoacetate synthase ThiH [Bacteroidales bacterium]
MKRFTEKINEYDWEYTSGRINSMTTQDVELALRKDKIEMDDFFALISPAAVPYLEQMALKSRQYTQQRFGKTMQLYIPLYLTNACTNHCVYCGFNHNNPIKRVILTESEIEKEAQAIRELGDFHHVLLVTGESPKHAGVEYLKKAIRIMKKYFSNISIEVQPLEMHEYKELIEEGLYSVYVYQETYNKSRYGIYHPAGKKRDFNYRLDTFDRLGEAGIHKMGLGILIGLEDWRTDAVMMAHHLRFLQKKYWRTRFSVSFPRMRPHEGEGFKPNVIMTDKELAQIIFAFRLLDKDVEIALSTREAPFMRDNMCALGVTSMSAGSKTEPGGYATYPQALEQWVMADNRTPGEVEEAIRQKGYEVVWKDWDPVMNGE